MLEIVSILCLITALGLLIRLSYIDLKEYILPNEYVLAFFCCGLIFHFATLFVHSSPIDMFVGMVIGGGFLLFIRQGAQLIYEQDALGLGDVKLMGAAGLWLGAQDILSALILGALIGLLHGLGVAAYKNKIKKQTVKLSRLSLPAGPGFTMGVIIIGTIKFLL